MLWMDLAWKRGIGCQLEACQHAVCSENLYYFSVLFISSLLVILRSQASYFFFKECVIIICAIYL